MEAEYEQHFPSVCTLTTEKKWFLQFFVGILLCVNNGACFCFSIFSNKFRSTPFQYSESQINAIATVGVLASYFSFPTGFLYDKKGPKLTLLVGSLLGCCGWMGLAYVFRPTESTALPLVQVLFFYGLSQMSSSFFETGTILTNMKAFSCYQGRVVMIQKTFMGLGTSVLAQIYFIFFQPYDSMLLFFVFLALYAGLVGVLSFAFVDLPTTSTMCLGLNVPDPRTLIRGGEPLLFKTPFNIATTALFASVIGLLAISLTENFCDIGTVLMSIFALFTFGSCASFMLMFFTTPNYTCNVGGYKYSTDAGELETEREVHSSANQKEMVAISSPVHEGMEDVLSPDDCVDRWNKKNHPSLDTTVESIMEAISTIDVEEDVELPPFLFGFIPTLREPFRLNNDSLKENIKKYEIWLLWFSCFAPWSAMTLVSSNCTPIYQAASRGTFDYRINAAYVSIFGVASALGRIFIGFMHPRLDKKKVAMTALLCLAPLVNTIGIPMFLLVSPTFLFIPFFLAGLSTGISWGAAIFIITVLFDQHNCGKHYSLLHSAGMLSAIVINTFIFGPTYDYFSMNTDEGSERVCNGLKCIMIPIIICFAFNLTAVPASILFVLKTVKNKGV